MSIVKKFILIINFNYSFNEKNKQIEYQNLNIAEQLHLAKIFNK